MVRPVAEYCSSVFYSMMTVSDSLEIERIQMQALKGIFGWKLSYRELLLVSGVDRLDERRETAFLELAKKLSESPRFSHWFPRRPVRRTGPSGACYFPSISSNDGTLHEIAFEQNAP